MEIKLPPLGSALDEDISLLQAIIKMTDPKTVVEFGFFHGKSAREMLEVLAPDARLVSYDNTKNGAIDDPRFSFKKKSQTDFEQIGGVDFVFIDASHRLDLNKQTWKRLEPCLSPNAIVAIHDTGTWADDYWNLGEGYWLEDRYVHRPEERAFVNWIRDVYPEYHQLHLHSETALRHGMTLLQKSKRLPL